MKAAIATVKAVATTIVRKTRDSSIAKPPILTADHADFKARINADLVLVGFGAETDEFEETEGGAEDDAADQAPGSGAEPFVDEPAGGAERDDGGEEGDARRVGEAGFAILVLIFLINQLTSSAASGSFSERRRARHGANGASSRE